MNFTNFKKYILPLVLLCFIWSCKNDKVAMDNKSPKKNQIIITGNVQHLKDTTLNFSYYEYKLLKDLTHVPVTFDSVGNFYTLIKAEADLKVANAKAEERRATAAAPRESLVSALGQSGHARAITAITDGSGAGHCRLRPSDGVSI